MTTFFDLDEANATLPEVRTILESLRGERSELIRLRDRVLLQGASPEAPASAPAEANVGGVSRPSDPPDKDDRDRDPEVRVLRLRMQGVIDRMQAGVVRIDQLGITLREIETGLIDFPALVSGRQIWLCWRLGEDDISFWHELGDGFGGRQALAELT